jgi:predicted transcriptional regulator
MAIGAAPMIPFVTVEPEALPVRRRAELGELTPAHAERHVGFESWEAMVWTLSPKRLELLPHVHRHPAKNIRARAAELGRDYRRVHEDAEALTPGPL